MKRVKNRQLVAGGWGLQLGSGVGRDMQQPAKRQYGSTIFRLRKHSLSQVGARVQQPLAFSTLCNRADSVRRLLLLAEPCIGDCGAGTADYGRLCRNAQHKDYKWLSAGACCTAAQLTQYEKERSKSGYIESYWAAAHWLYVRPLAICASASVATASPPHGSCMSAEEGV